MTTVPIIRINPLHQTIDLVLYQEDSNINTNRIVTRVLRLTVPLLKELKMMEKVNDRRDLSLILEVVDGFEMIFNNMGRKEKKIRRR